MATTHPNYDATFCGRLPLNQTNLIQPQGVVILLAKDNFEIIQASENITALLNIPVTDIVNKPFTDYAADGIIETIKEKTGKSGSKLPLTVTFNKEGKAVSYSALIHQKQEYYVLEVDLPQYIDATQHSFSAVYQQLKVVMAAIDAATSVYEVCTIAAQQIKAISGFDKVMVYSFDNDWNGTVLAEEMEEGMDSYLGLKFPASDIPKPARELYLKNPYRLIPNRSYTPVKLYPLLNPKTNSFSDLSDCNLRSVAGVHLEYLKNMGVVASMSTRIIHNEQLWGLISCHHRTAKYLSFEMCSIFELLSNAISSKISSLHNKDAFTVKSHLNDLYSHLIEQIYKQKSILMAFTSNATLITQLLCADGVAICWNGKTELLGNTPGKYEVENLVYWLQSREAIKTVQLPSLPDTFEDALEYADKGSGLLALPIQADRGNFLLAFKPEVIKKVSWGGNPDEAITFDKDSTLYHPRNSFAVWQETVKHTAIPWSKEEVEIAEQLRNFLVEYTLNNL